MWRAGAASMLRNHDSHHASRHAVAAHGCPGQAQGRPAPDHGRRRRTSRDSPCRASTTWPSSGARTPTRASAGSTPSAALKRPGVVAVVTGADLKPHCAPVPLGAGVEGGGGDAQAAIGRKHYPLAIDRVRHVGEAVAAVIADTGGARRGRGRRRRRRLGAAARRERPARGPEAGRPAAPRRRAGQRRAREPDHSRRSGRRLRQGVQGRAPAHGQPAACGVPMEGRATWPPPTPPPAGSSSGPRTQAPHACATSSRRRSGCRAEPDARDRARGRRRVRGEVRRLSRGRGAGGDGQASTASPCAGSETRVEHMMATTHGRAQVTDVEAAVEQDGTITALRMHVRADIGAYPDLHVHPRSDADDGRRRLPASPNVDLQSTCVFTNTHAGGGLPRRRPAGGRLLPRAHHGPDRAASWSCRRRRCGAQNFIPPSAFPYKTPTGQHYDSGEYDRALTKALQISNYDALRDEQERAARAGRTASSSASAWPATSRCAASARSRAPSCASSPRAPSRPTPAPRLTARATRRPSRRSSPISWASTSTRSWSATATRRTPRMGNGTGGSRSLAVGGSAILRATVKVQEQGAPHRRPHAGGRLRRRRARRRALPGARARRRAPSRLAQIAAHAYGDKLPDGHRVRGWRRPTSSARPSSSIPSARTSRSSRSTARRVRCACATSYSVDDCGVRISPILVAGQVHGGLAQGIAQALWEEVVYAPDGQLVTGSLMDYASRARRICRRSSPTRPSRRRRSTRSAPRASARRRRSARRRPSSTRSSTRSGRSTSATSTCPCAPSAAGSSPRANEAREIR